MIKNLDLIKDACDLSTQRSQPFTKSIVQIIVKDIISILEEGDKTQSTSSGIISSIKDRYSSFLKE